MTPTSQKHQDPSVVGEHGCGHPVGAGRTDSGPPRCVEGGGAPGSGAAADAGARLGSREEVARALRPPRRSLWAVGSCKSSCALIGPTCQKRWRQPPWRAHQRGAPSPLAWLLLPFRPQLTPFRPLPLTSPKSSQGARPPSVPCTPFSKVHPGRLVPGGMGAGRLF